MQRNPPDCIPDIFVLRGTARPDNSYQGPIVGGQRLIMQNRTKTLLYSLLGKTKEGQKLFFCRKLHGYLDETGWIKSKMSHMPIDRNGDPLPWFTYPSIAFLAGRVEPGMSVFEYGSGNSTLWWSKRVARVVACEHHDEWYNYLKDRLPANVEYVHQALETGGDYCKSILRFDERFDIVAIDGRDRVNCAKAALPKLHERGVIIWDNTDREKYQEGFIFLADNGFRKLDFEGPGPAKNNGWRTSIFYRDDNCLNI